MSEKFIVTITREFGSMGRPIAKRLSELLHVEYYDRDIVEAASQKLDLPVSVISNEEEKDTSGFFEMLFPLGTESAEWHHHGTCGEGILYYRRTLFRLCPAR